MDSINLRDVSFVEGKYFKKSNELINADSNATAFSELLFALGELQTRIQRAQNPFFFEIGIKEKEFDMSDPAEKTEFYRFVANKLCDFTEPLERGNYLEAVAKKYSIDEMGLRELVTHLDDEVSD